MQNKKSSQIENFFSHFENFFFFQLLYHPFLHLKQAILSLNKTVLKVLTVLKDLKPTPTHDQQNDQQR